MGTIEGLPRIPTYSPSIDQAERDLVNALEGHLRGLMDQEATRLQLDEFPTMSTLRLYIWSSLV